MTKVGLTDSSARKFPADVTSSPRTRSRFRFRVRPMGYVHPCSDELVFRNSTVSVTGVQIACCTVCGIVFRLGFANRASVPGVGQSLAREEDVLAFTRLGTRHVHIGLPQLALGSVEYDTRRAHDPVHRPGCPARRS